MTTTLTQKVIGISLAINLIAFTTAAPSWSGQPEGPKASDPYYKFLAKNSPVVSIQASPKTASFNKALNPPLPPTGLSKTLKSESDADPEIALSDVYLNETADFAFAAATLDPSGPRPLSLIFESEMGGATRMEVYDEDEVVYEFYLDQERFEVTSHLSGVTHSERWVRPAGDLIDFLDRDDHQASRLSKKLPFEPIPEHDRMIGAIGAMVTSDTEMLAKAVRRTETASRIYSHWWTRAVLNPYFPVRNMPTPVKPRPKPDPTSCTYPDSKTASTLKRNVSIMGKAELAVTANQVEISAFCESRAGCLAASSSVRFDAVSDNADRGGNGCPMEGTEWGEEEFKVAKLSFHADASVKEGCALNYDRKDAAYAFKATISAAGLADVDLSTTEATGDGIGGESRIDGTAVVCYEDDTFSDDIQDLMLTGTASSKLW